MFEATFKITALVESNEQGQRVFKLLKHEAPVDDDGFLSLVAMPQRHRKDAAFPRGRAA